MRSGRLIAYRPDAYAQQLTTKRGTSGFCVTPHQKMGCRKLMLFVELLCLLKVVRESRHS
ncbi:hypothetical protein CEV34_5670 [Brucella pseudogrignonensis]|uniref:Uncharacterized protein n=1 Tax=Brucella pseudogrignonensis TaxID=419475 RepID=A0A256GCU7_9HYPH|nr:hypothetical protein CEV34_5670 [Brucella pseudogrignonensis]